MDNVNLDNILVTSLKRIPTVGGDVLHALRNFDTGFNGFGEVYFSWVEQGAINNRDNGVVGTVSVRSTS